MAENMDGSNQVLERIYDKISDLSDQFTEFRVALHSRVAVVEQKMAEHIPPCRHFQEHICEHVKRDTMWDMLKAKAFGTLIAIGIFFVVGAVIYALARGYLGHVNLSASPVSP